MPTKEWRPWIQVNAITSKLSNGETVRVPTVRGWWKGYDTEAAVAWVYDVGWVCPGRSGWVAQVGRDAFGPVTLARAKVVAEAMARDDGTVEPYSINLNSLQSTLFDEAAL
jgi:hypothetical protein